MTARSSFHCFTISVFQKTANRVEKEKANIDINLDEGEEELKTLPEYYTTAHPVREGAGT